MIRVNNLTDNGHWVISANNLTDNVHWVISASCPHKKGAINQQ